MATKPLPSVELLRKLFQYDAETGFLLWLPRNPDMFKDTIRTKEHNCNIWNAKFAGKEAGSLNKKGYKIVCVNSSLYKAHRIIWMLNYGVEPTKEPDHINRNGSDNRIINLRDATRSQQCINVKIRKDNTTGVKGVSFHIKTGKFQSIITVNKKSFYLGIFDTLEEAVSARKEAEFKYHGKLL